MNETIDTILSHRSIRKFKDEKLTKEQIHTIVQSAQQASTSSFVMAYTIIGITDESKKQALMEVSGQPYVKNNGHLFVFCGDLHRANVLGERAKNADHASITETIESTEQFIVTVIDTALAAQNAVLAAESMGLGACFLGSLRNDINKVNDLLNLPKHVVPLFGLAVGYPDQQPEIKPRPAIETIYHENNYLEDEKQAQFIGEFDKKLKDYYNKRSTNTRIDTWTEQMIRKYSNPQRLDVTPFLHSKQLNKR
ncbi:oxygen-insensitive NADPH nitroreductase [Virgibacillus xinjiangensis]|uniref:Oxygen-insensitive NADPH nitroreductase n=1 Tax=Virgibacillus xinjiangensis TaxID=393090 RepID=A0ABV7CU78_9BACI